MQRLNITLEDLFNIESAVIYNPDPFKPVIHVSTDSRDIRSNSLFVAIKGDRFDGHDFVKQAVKNGARTIVIKQSKLKEYDSINVTIVTVKDTIKAYGEIANAWRKKLNAIIVSITGSNGKTTTKEMAATILSERFKVRKSIANNNNHIGVPLTILSSKQSDEVLLLEHGTNHFNEIKYTAEIAEPDYAMITNIGESHLEFLKNKNGVYKEKSALFDAALKNKGQILVNLDDNIISRKTKSIKRKVTYGFDGRPNIKAKIEGYDKHGNPKLKIKHNGKEFNFNSPLPGNSNAQNLLAAITIALTLGMNQTQIKRGVGNIKPVKGRLNIVKIRGTTLIDDTYNSNPVSVKEALDVLSKVSDGKIKIVVLGDMFELGPGAGKYHESLATDINNIKPAHVLLIGKLMKHLHKKLPKTKFSVDHFKNRNELKKKLQSIEMKNSVVLVKGSRGMKMEEFIDTIKNKAA